MNSQQQQAILTIALFAAFADGGNDDREREEIRRLAEALGSEPGAPDLAGLYREVLLKRVNLENVALALPEAEHRQLAYEMAVCVCDADGRTTEAERHFLADLSRVLGLNAAITAPLDRQAEAMAELTETAAPPSTPSRNNAAPVATVASVSEAEIDRSILNYAILNGALELLPQSWASMAIIPIQIKMVYGIGKLHGHDLDQGHIRELLATLGIGLTSQYLEQFGRKLLGGLLGKVAGGMGKGIGKAATSVAFSFATTYALGQVAKRYYAGGRQMNTAVLQDSFNNLLGPAKEMQAQYLPQIRDKAQNLDMGQVMSLVRGA
ncbi:MAG: DUF533 domain-containing protein [Betaproteobacteria bacterium]|nr:DUF533 domain-containing protein [Betaproteobacteria bacterium]